MSIEKLKKCYIGDAGCVVREGVVGRVGEGGGARVVGMVEINTAYAYIGASPRCLILRTRPRGNN